jgi:hypothetical protein
MRETLSRHFDVVVVVWVLTLALAWSMVAITRSQTQPDWSTTTQNSQGWNYTTGTGW